MLYITGVHLAAGGTRAEHIASVWWLQVDGKSSTMTTAQAVDYIDKGNTASVGGPKGPVGVQVVRPEGRQPYLRSHADGEWTDNLLNLPKF
jgi:hypothetical protein